MEYKPTKKSLLPVSDLTIVTRCGLGLKLCRVDTTKHSSLESLSLPIMQYQPSYHLISYI